MEGQGGPVKEKNMFWIRHVQRRGCWQKPMKSGAFSVWPHDFALNWCQMELLTTNTGHSIPTLTLASCSCCRPGTSTCVICWTTEHTTKQHPFRPFPWKGLFGGSWGWNLELTQLKRIIFLPLLLFGSGWNLVLYNREGVGPAASLSCICLKVFTEAESQWNADGAGGLAKT